MKNLPTSKIAERFVNGSLIDRIAGAFIYGVHKITLSDTERKRMEAIEITIEIINQSAGNQNLAIKRLQNHPTLACSYTQAYNLIQDAKYCTPALLDFDFSYELFLKKQRIEDCISECFEKKFFDLIPKYEAEHMKVLEAIERSVAKKKKPQKLVINLHMDMTRLGISKELYEEWSKELYEEIIPSVKRKYKGYDIQDAEFEELK